jgi:hypothetical protein
VQRHNEQRSTDRLRCLEQLTNALDEASNLLLTLEVQKELYTTAINVHRQIQIARLEAESLKRLHRPRQGDCLNDIDVALWPAVGELIPRAAAPLLHKRVASAERQGYGLSTITDLGHRSNHFGDWR